MSNRFQPLRRLISKMSLPWLLLSIAGALSLIETAIALWVPLLTRDLVDAAGVGGVPRALLTTLVVALLVQAAISGVSLYLLSRAGEDMTAFLRRALFGRLVRLPMSFHDNAESGQLVSRTLSDTASVETLLTQHAVAFLSGLVSMVGAVVILCLLDWQLTAVLFATVIAGLLLTLPVTARLQAVGRDVQQQQATFSGRLAGLLAEMRLVKAACAEQFEGREAARAVDRLRQLGLTEAKILALLGPTITLSMTGALVVILGYGGARVGSGELAVGTLIAFILYLFQVVLPMVHLSTFFAAFNKAAGAAEHLVELLDEPIEDPVLDGDTAPPRAALAFRGVRFGYDGSAPVLDGFDLDVPAGRVTALVGPSGSGKTTVLSLVERLYSPSQGSITVGGQALHELALEPWRRRIGYVSQEAPMLSGTIRDNLFYGLTETPSEAAVASALQAARADGFVAELAEGLETPIGERGVKLSGGQRQRLAITRAFLVDPEILMLDEATANLDAESESAVREALAELERGRTTLVVAHRLSTIVDADQIAVVEKGRVTGIGRHDELVRSHDLYCQLVERQHVSGSSPAVSAA